MILLDTSGLLAALDASQSHHAEAAARLAAAHPPLLLSPFVLAELDYLIASRVGLFARGFLLEEGTTWRVPARDDDRRRRRPGACTHQTLRRFGDQLKGSL